MVDKPNVRMEYHAAFDRNIARFSMTCDLPIRVAEWIEDSGKYEDFCQGMELSMQEEALRWVNRCQEDD